MKKSMAFLPCSSLMEGIWPPGRRLEACSHPLRICALLGGSNTTVTRPFPRWTHQPHSSLPSGKFGPRVATSVSRSSCLRYTHAPHGARPLPIAIGAAHVHLPAGGLRYAHVSTSMRTNAGITVGVVKPRVCDPYKMLDVAAYKLPSADPCGGNRSIQC